MLGSSAYIGRSTSCAESCGSISVRHRASARRSRCSTRVGAAGSAGTDVVIGLVVTHGRPKTIAQIRDLEIVPPRRVEYRGQTWEEVDVDAILARRPQVVLVDELAHTNVPGSRHEKRWQDIEELLDAGIEVISTVEHPAPRERQRRRQPHHRRGPARDGSRRGGAPRRPDRARRHEPRGAAAPDGARQHLRAGEGRRRARQLLPARQSRRAARARAALGRRSGRGLAAALHGTARHHELVGDARAGARRADRRAGRRRPHPASGAHGPPRRRAI